MRALFTVLPGTGPLHPLVPVAAALEARGHQVAFVSSPALAAEVGSHGFEFFAAGLDWHTSDPGYIERMCEAAGGLTFPPLVGLERLAWVTGNLFIGGHARHMLPDLVGIAEQWRADLIVRQFLELSGCLAAEQLGLPHASVADAAHSAVDRRSELAGHLAPLRAAAGLLSDAAGDMVYRHLHLCFAPPAFDGPGACFPETARFYRHRSVTRPGRTLPGWLAGLPARPTVLVSLGTVFHRTPGVYEAIVDGLRHQDVNVLVAAGEDLDPARFGPLPAHVRVERYLPVSLVLPHADVFVTHGGFNSVKESLAAGVPMVVVPVSADQPYAAERCEALGVGVRIGPDERTPDRIGAAVGAALNDPALAAAARRAKAEMEALPPVEQAALDLEALVAASISERCRAPGPLFAM